jgi:hypothetical protein
MPHYAGRGGQAGPDSDLSTFVFPGRARDGNIADWQGMSPASPQPGEAVSLIGLIFSHSLEAFWLRASGSPPRGFPIFPRGKVTVPLCAGPAPEAQLRCREDDRSSALAGASGIAGPAS